MNCRLIAAGYYTDDNVRSVLTHAFIENFIFEKQTVFICIGSDHHMLDCLGPLTGTMLQEQRREILVIGTLQEPVHGANLRQKLKEVDSRYPLHRKVAIDASIGDAEQPGLIKLKKGPIKPGKAVLKRLPQVGDYAITGLVGNRADRLHHNSSVSLGDVYSMSRVISDAVISWYEHVSVN